MDKNDIKILVVEDEEIIRTMFKQSFENWGYQVDVAENGKNAIEKCRENLYHIIITDLNMPIMNGMELLKRIKAKWPFIEVTVITGFATIESAIEAMKLGAFDFILKPVNFEHVQFIINKCFQKICSQAENSELRQMNARLTELNELKDKFIYITNHEIRTPLTILRGYLEILTSILENPNQEVAEVLEILGNTTNELSELVERLHILEGFEKSQLSPAKQVINLNRLMNKVSKEIAGLFNSRNIDLQIYIDKQPMQIIGDYRYLRLILRELLQNALKFTKDGGKVKVSLKLKNNEIHYSVRDNGLGIPFDKQDVIFESFYEIQDTINHKTSKNEFMGGGLGIGLSLVKNIVTSMEGQIFVESEPDRGSLFHIILPAFQQKQEQISDVLQDISIR